LKCGNIQKTADPCLPAQNLNRSDGRPQPLTPTLSRGRGGALPMPLQIELISSTLACRLSLKSDAALAFDAGLLDRVHLAVRQCEIVRLLLIDAAGFLGPDDHGR
jgi:hypothetical protein